MNVGFVTETGDYLIPDSKCLLVFMDETGDESLSDKNYPIFGIGGCCITMNSYHSNIIKPWIYLKEKEFGGEATQMHACDLRPNNNQIEILNKFFTKCFFGRFATIITNETEIPPSVENFEIVARSTFERVKHIANNSDINSVAFIFEESQRGDKLAARFFEGYDFQTISGKLPLIKLRMPKTEREPGLEVADFIIHTAGTQTRNRIRGNSKFRKDFELIFRQFDTRLVSFLELTKIKNNC